MNNNQHKSLGAPLMITLTLAVLGTVLYMIQFNNKSNKKVKAPTDKTK